MKNFHEIVRRLHCIGTHHRMATDALACVHSDAGERFVPWLLVYHREYLRGSTDPDKRFRDYHNHILHVRDGNWGGAPRVAHQWYNRLIDHMTAERFRQAAHAAGVLSHYITDLAQPLHTASDRREALIHYPLEWSIDRSYQRILSRWHRDQIHIATRLPNQRGWLGSMMIQMAKIAESRFDELVNRYDFEQGVRHPRHGLDEESERILAELFALAITCWARVVDRAAIETETRTGYEIPRCGHTIATASAVLSLPVAFAKKFLWQVVGQARNQRLAEEYARHGELKETLPAEIDIKRRVIQVRARETENRSARRAA